MRMKLHEIMNASNEEVSEEVKAIVSDALWDWILYIEGGRVGDKPDLMIDVFFKNDRTLTDDNYK